MGPHETNDVRGRRRAAASSVTIREATALDAVGVAALLGELGYPSSPAQAAERIERTAADPSTWVIVAEVESEPAGLGALHVQNLVERDEPVATVADLAVAFCLQGLRG